MANNKPVNKVWVLTREHNLYDQEGEYFEAVWIDKPTTEQLARYFGHSSHRSNSVDVMAALAFILHVEKGGGRQGNEDVWYNLKHVDVSK